MLAQLTLNMIETAFCTFSQSNLRKQQSQDFFGSLKQISARWFARTKRLNDTDFPKEFSCYE